MKPLLALVLVMFCGMAWSSPLSKGGKDWIYLYGTPNRTYLCDMYHFYVETQFYGTAFADQCVQVGEDNEHWPVFPRSPIRLSLDFSSKANPRLEKDCSFVSHVYSPNIPSSWTNVDCR